MAMSGDETFSMATRYLPLRLLICLTRSDFYPEMLGAPSEYYPFNRLLVIFRIIGKSTCEKCIGFFRRQKAEQKLQ